MDFGAALAYSAEADGSWIPRQWLENAS